MSTQQRAARNRRSWSDSWHVTQKRLFVETKSPPRHTTIGDVIYKVADCRMEREAAFRLVYKSYTAAGLMDENSYRMRVSPHHLLPTTAVFIAICDGALISTVSLIGDGELGLPMESIYHTEVNELRERGLCLAEVSCLADRRRDKRRAIAVLMNLNRLMAQYARHNGTDQLLIAVHPRHERFYRRYMGFERIGAEKSYPSVLDNPAVAACVDFARLDRDRLIFHPERYDFFFADRIPASALESRPIPESDAEYFGPAAAVCDSHVGILA